MRRSAFDAPAFESYLDLATHSRAQSGNRVTPLLDGVKSADEYALGGSGKMVFSRGNPKGDHPWRDVDLKLEGPSVQDAQAAFLRNWKELGPDVPHHERARLMAPVPRQPQNVSARVVQHRPDEEGDRNVELLYLKAVNTVTHQRHRDDAPARAAQPLRHLEVARAWQVGRFSASRMRGGAWPQRGRHVPGWRHGLVLTASTGVRSTLGG